MKDSIHVVSLSGGKDSSAMLLGMINRHMPIDEILFFDWGKEFSGMYQHLDQLQDYVYRKIRRDITILSSQQPFEYWLFEHRKTTRSRYTVLGYGWPRYRHRWCTRIKVNALNKTINQYKKHAPVIQYIGYAIEEEGRAQRLLNKNFYYKFPLIDWKMTEQAALKYCYDMGFQWEGLYEIFFRVSCFCCPLSSQLGLFKLYKYFPEYWEKMAEWDKQTFNTLKQDYSFEYLEKKFQGMIKQKCLFEDTQHIV